MNARCARYSAATTAKSHHRRRPLPTPRPRTVPVESPGHRGFGHGSCHGNLLHVNDVVTDVTRAAVEFRPMPGGIFDVRGVVVGGVMDVRAAVWRFRLWRRGTPGRE